MRRTRRNLRWHSIFEAMLLKNAMFSFIISNVHTFLTWPPILWTTWTGGWCAALFPSFAARNRAGYEPAALKAWRPFALITNLTQPCLPSIPDSRPSHSTVPTLPLSPFPPAFHFCTLADCVCWAEPGKQRPVGAAEGRPL